jgi:tetratricopeptide (TPR) repeat protein
MTRFFSISACILVLLAGIFTTQCRGKKDGQEEGGDLSKAEMILKARTLGLAYLEEGDLESAEAEFLKLVKLVPDEAIGYANLGLVYLRTGELGDAEKNLRKAVELSPEDTFMRLNLATVYRYRNEKEKMVDELEKILKIQPDHVQALYALAEASWDVDDPQMQERREDYLERTVAAAPANIVPRLQLAELLLTLGKPDQALEQLEEVRRIFPEFPAEAGEYLDQASRAIHSSDVEGALTAVRIFHNYLKLTSTYNRGVTELQGHEGRAMGIPTFSFSERAPMMVQSAGSILDAIRFTDVTASAGLDLTGEGTGSLDGEKAAATHVSVGDYNHDGADDIYLGTYLPGSSAYRHFLFKSEMGRFKDVSKEAGIDHKGEESQALFADYDNDGWFDLFIVNEGAPLLYKSMSEGTYGNISRKAFPDRRNDVRMGLFVDTDHEGDLDLFLATRGANTLYLNRGDAPSVTTGKKRAWRRMFRTAAMPVSGILTTMATSTCWWSTRTRAAGCILTSGADSSGMRPPDPGLKESGPCRWSLRRISIMTAIWTSSWPAKSRPPSGGASIQDRAASACHPPGVTAWNCHPPSGRRMQPSSISTMTATRTCLSAGNRDRVVPGVCSCSITTGVGPIRMFPTCCPGNWRVEGRSPWPISMPMATWISSWPD